MHYFHVKTTDAFGTTREQLITTAGQHDIYHVTGVKPSSEIKELTALEHEQIGNEWQREQTGNEWQCDELAVEPGDRRLQSYVFWGTLGLIPALWLVTSLGASIWTLWCAPNPFGTECEAWWSMVVDDHSEKSLRKLIGDENYCDARNYFNGPGCIAGPEGITWLDPSQPRTGAYAERK